MNSDFEKYDKACDEIRTHNNALLDAFDASQREQSITESTIKKHRWNIEFFINEFLLDEDAVPANEGTPEIGTYLGYWFAKKASWASPSAIKENAASLKKFYTFLFERGEIPEEDLYDLKVAIKEEMPKWQRSAKRFF